MGTQRPFEKKLFWLALSISIPASVGLIFVLIVGNHSPYLVALVSVILAMQITFTAYKIKTDTAHQFRTMANLLDALTRGDYSLRGRHNRHRGALNELVDQINILAETLTRQRLEVKASQVLLAKVISQINVAIFTFDEHGIVRLANPAAAGLFASEATKLKGKSSKDLHLDALLLQPEQVLHWAFPNQQGRYQIRVDHFIEQGQTHTLLFVTNVQELLREEERKAWQNLIRVISHEINNSLTPIASLSETLQMMIAGAEQADSLKEGLLVISDRARSLRGFIDSYRQLAKLPPPSLASVDLATLLTSVATLYPDTEIHIQANECGPIQADPVQLKQLFINLIKNAIEAQAGTRLVINIEVANVQDKVVVTVSDNGTGISNPDNLFTPFYSTKPSGSGIGLVLCRQIVEAHQGHLRITNNAHGGCTVSVELADRTVPTK